MYCETQQRFPGKTWTELFPDDSFPNETPEDKIRSKTWFMELLCNAHSRHL